MLRKPTSFTIKNLDRDLYQDEIKSLFDDNPGFLQIRLGVSRASGPHIDRRQGFGHAFFSSYESARVSYEKLNFRVVGRFTICLVYDIEGQLDPEANLIIKHLDDSFTPRVFFNLCIEFGHVLSCRLCTNFLGKTLGYGYVQYVHKKEAEVCIQNIRKLLRDKPEIEAEVFSAAAKRAKNSIFIQNFPPEATESEVKILIDARFAVVGPIKHQSVFRDQKKGTFAAKVGYLSEETAQLTVKRMQGFKINEAAPPLSVSIFLTWEEQQAENRKCNLYVKNFPPDFDEQQIEEFILREFGKVALPKSVSVKESRFPGKFQAFVAYDTPEQAGKAIWDLDGFPFPNRSETLYVALVLPRNPETQQTRSRSPTPVRRFGSTTLERAKSPAFQTRHKPDLDHSESDRRTATTSRSKQDLPAPQPRLELPAPRFAAPDKPQLPDRKTLEELPENLRLEILRFQVHSKIAAHEFFADPTYAKHLQTASSALLSANSSEDRLMELVYTPDLLDAQIDEAAICILDREEA